MNSRQAIRQGRHTGPTAGLAPGRVQANLVILPADLAPDFSRFCRANPKPCPLLAETRPGDPTFPSLGAEIDVRTDLPRYRVFRDGELADEPTDIRRYWRDDLVAFAIGCSFSFEQAQSPSSFTARHFASIADFCVNT